MVPVHNHLTSLHGDVHLFALKRAVEALPDQLDTLLEGVADDRSGNIFSGQGAPMLPDWLLFRRSQ
jgi:hypothetical protein